MATVSVDIELDEFSTQEILSELHYRYHRHRRNDKEVINQALRKFGIDPDDVARSTPDSMADVLKQELADKLARYATIDQIETEIRQYCPNAL